MRSEHQCDSQRDNELHALAQLLLDVLNGDWSLPRLQHWCVLPRCPCKGRFETLVQLVVSLLYRAVIEPASSRTPAMIKWHTYAQSFEGGALGKMLCNILERVLLQVYTDKPLG